MGPNKPKLTFQKGGLHRSLGVPEGEKIPPAKMEAASHSPSPKIRKQVALAHALRKMRG
jgi:hypothetical protein